MAIKQDVEREPGQRDASELPADELQVEAGMDAGPGAEGLQVATPDDHAMDGSHDVALVGAMAPSQLGVRRFVYAAYFAAAIGIAFLLSKMIDFAWLKLQAWRPVVGEPRDEIVMPLAALVGIGVALYYWFRTRARQLAEEVTDEMSKVTWPTRTEVSNGTVVVIITTLVSTVFFALMDRFWGFVTNLVYGGT
ncbi:MAG: preprotein translocase subunit SecE [Polyangiaceae bacterium]|jgi:preprotein translocase SecE subunit